VSPTSAARVYKSKALPKIMFSVSVSNLSDKAITLLENGHWAIAKNIQGLPSRTPNVAVLLTLGWMSLESYVFIGQLRFLANIIVLDPGHIYKQIGRFLYVENVVIGSTHESSPMRTK
jgi:hypothetical protein